MIIKIKDKEIDLNRVKNIYPSAIVKDEEGNNSPISIEWIKENREKVDIVGYAILIIFKDNEKRCEIFFDDYEEMIETLITLYNKIAPKN